jgi:general secretion pathway protein N
MVEGKVMALRLTSNPRRTLFVGLLVVGALLIVTFQQASDFAQAIMAPRGDAQLRTKLTSATKSVPRNVELSSNGLRQDSIGRDNALWSIPLASLTATRERPIFSPTRRPSPILVKPAPTEAASTGQPSLALVGAIAGENDGIAIFLDGATKNIIRMKTGESHGEWTLRAVKAREAILQSEQKTSTLTLPAPPAK